MEYQLFCGIDPAKSSFDYHLLSPHEVSFGQGQVLNCATAIDSFIKDLLDKHQLSGNQILICIENTGYYTNQLVHALLTKKIPCWIVDALHLNRSMGRVRGKNDRLDARRIAKFACRNYQDARPHQATPEVISQLNSLVRQRERMLKSIHQLRVGIQEEKAMMLNNTQGWYTASEQAIKALAEQLKIIEQHIAQLIASDQRLSRINAVLQSVPGIGPINACLLLITTHGFSRLNNGRQLAAYIGLAPYPYESGSSIKRKASISSLGCRKIKAKLTMGARSVSRTNNRLGKFYQKKISEGKLHKVALNALKNKMIKTACACVKKDVMYDENFVHVLA